MPTWLVHGFRWPRALLRIHVIIQNIDDAAPDWIMGPTTSASLLENFHQLYPEIMENLPSLRFIEQYDPEDLETKSEPYAYVCDQVHEVKLGVDVDEVRGQGVKTEAWEALVDLRDKIAPGQKTGWYVVVNGDVERWAPPVDEDEDGDLEGSQVSLTSRRSSVEKVETEEAEQATREPKGFKKWFTGKRRSKSSKDLRGDLPIPDAPPSSYSDVPDVPNVPRSLPALPPNKTATLPKKLNGIAQQPKGAKA